MQSELQGLDPIGIEKVPVSIYSRQGLLIDKYPEGSPDGPRAGACGTPADDAPSQDKLHLPLAVALEHDHFRTQGRWKKRTEKPASGKNPIAGIQDMGGEVVRLSESADEGAQQAPCEAARNGDRPASALHGHGTADDVLLPQFPCISVWICIPLCSDTFRPCGEDTVDNTLILPRRLEDDHVPSPQLFDTAVGEMNPVTRPEKRAHAFTAAEDRVAVRFTRLGHAVFYPPASRRKRGLSLFTRAISRAKTPPIA
jgi:hypothetical protein